MGIRIPSKQEWMLFFTKGNIPFYHPHPWMISLEKVHLLIQRWRHEFFLLFFSLYCNPVWSDLPFYNKNILDFICPYLYGSISSLHGKCSWKQSDFFLSWFLSWGKDSPPYCSPHCSRCALLLGCNHAKVFRNWDSIMFCLP